MRQLLNLPEDIHIGLVLRPCQVDVHSSGQAKSFGGVTVWNLAHHDVGEVKPAQNIQKLDQWFSTFLSSRNTNLKKSLAEHLCVAAHRLRNTELDNTNTDVNFKLLYRLL